MDYSISDPDRTQLHVQDQPAQDQDGSQKQQQQQDQGQDQPQGASASSASVVSSDSDPNSSKPSELAQECSKSAILSGKVQLPLPEQGAFESSTSATTATATATSTGPTPAATSNAGFVTPAPGSSQPSLSSLSAFTTTTNANQAGDYAALAKQELQRLAELKSTALDSDDDGISTPSLPPPTYVLPYRGAPIITPKRVIPSPLRPIPDTLFTSPNELRKAPAFTPIKETEEGPSERRRPPRITPPRRANDYDIAVSSAAQADLDAPTKYALDSPTAEIAKLGPGSPHRVHLRALARAAERAGAHVVEVPEEPQAPAPIYTPEHRSRRDSPLFSTPRFAPVRSSATFLEPSPDLHAATLIRLQELKSQVEAVVTEESYRLSSNRNY